MSYDYQAYLKTNVTIQSMSTGSVDERGLFNSDWSQASTTVGRLVSQRSDEEAGNINLGVDEFFLYIPATVSIEKENRVQIGSDYFDVEGIEDRFDRYGTNVIKQLRIRKSR